MNTASFVALSLSLVACATDLRSRRIPNVLTFGGAAAGLLFHAITGGAAGAGTSALGWLTGCAIFLLPFAMGGMGAGDVKLVAALGAWLGPAHTLWLALYTGVAGGVLALVVAAARGYLAQALRNVWRLLAYWRVVGMRPLDELTLAHGAGPRLAYGVAILAGTMVTVWLH